MSFYKVMPIDASDNFKHDRSAKAELHSYNWSIERTVLLAQLTSMSIQNIVSALRVINDVPASDCKFVRPEEDDAFVRPWTFSTGLTNASFNEIVDQTNTNPVTKIELEERIKMASIDPNDELKSVDT